MPTARKNPQKWKALDLEKLERDIKFLIRHIRTDYSWLIGGEYNARIGEDEDKNNKYFNAKIIDYVVEYSKDRGQQVKANIMNRLPNVFNRPSLAQSDKGVYLKHGCAFGPNEMEVRNARDQDVQFPVHYGMRFYLFSYCVFHYQSPTWNTKSDHAYYDECYGHFYEVYNEYFDSKKKGEKQKGKYFDDFLKAFKEKETELIDERIIGDSASR